MSKQSEAKKSQGYTTKPVLRTCRNCINFTSEMSHPKWMLDGKHEAFLAEPSYAEETNKRCDIGGFAVVTSGSCNKWRAIP